MPDDFLASTLTTGRVLSNGVASTGSIEVLGDADWFMLTLVAGNTYDLRLNRTAAGGLGDPFLHLYNSVGGQIAFDDDAGGSFNSLITFNALVSGTYFLGARAFGNASTGAYLVSATPRDDFAASTFTTGQVTVNGNVTGLVGVSGDADWFRTTLTAGVTYTIRLDGSGPGAIDDPFLNVYNSAGNSIAFDDDSGPGFYSLLTFTPATSGIYFLGARGYDGNDTGAYLLSVAEPDDFAGNSTTTGSVAVNGPAVSGQIEMAGDQDWFAVTLNAGVTYLLRANTAVTGGVGDPMLGLHNSAGVRVAFNDDGVGLNSLISYTAPSTGTYYLSAQGYSNHTGDYTVSASSSDDFAATTATAGRVYVNSVPSSGRIEIAGDRDWFAVTLTQGVSYQLRVNAAAQGPLGDPYLDLYNSAGVRITGDDDSGGGLNSLLNFNAPSTGTYFLSARGLGNTTGAYTVSAQSGDDFASNTGTSGAVAVGGSSTGNVETSGDQDWFAVTLAAGQTYTLNLRGAPSGAGMTMPDPYLRGIYNSSGTLLPSTANDDYGGTLESRVVFTPAASGTYFVAAGGYASSVGTYRLQVSQNAVVNDIANNAMTAATIAVNGFANSTIAPSGDQDWFRATLTAGVRYVVEESANYGTGSQALDDPYFRGVHNAAGTLIAGTSNDDYGLTLNSRVSFTAPTTGTYYLSAGGYGGHTGAYTLRLNQVAGTVDALAASTATTGLIAVGGNLNSRVDYAFDIDWIRATLTGGTSYAIEVLGSPSNSGTLADPSLIGVYNAAGVIINGSGADDGPGTVESVSIFRPTTTGTYYLAVGADGDGIGTYRLSLQTVANNLDIPANSTTTARVQVGGNFSSQVDSVGDVDWIRVALTAGVTYRIQELGATGGHGSLADPRIFGIYNPAGQAVPGSANDDSGGTLNSSVTFTASQTADYFIAAGAYGTHTGSYRVSVGPAAAPDIAAPLLQSTTPADNSTAVPITTNLSLVFNEAIRAGTGNVVITGGGTSRQIAVTDAQQVSFNGEVMTINPTSGLAANTAYAVTMGSGVVQDIAGNNFAGISSNTQFNFGTAGAAVNTDDRWTIMVYLAADNNLEPFGVADLNEMEMPTLPANVNVVTLFDRAPGYDSSNSNWTDTRRGAIVHDSNTGTISSPLVSQGELNTGSGATLTSFINWAASNHPAQRYGLVIWDHGGGLSGTAWDDSSGGDNLRSAELRTAIDNSNVAHFDLIGFDACLQGMVEQAWDLRSLTDVVVASQELEPGDGWEYNTFLAQLAANPDMTAANLGTAIVTTYGQRYTGESDITLSAVRTNALPALETAIDNFVAAVGPAPSAATLTALRTAADHAQPLGSSYLDYRDLGDFMDEVIANVNSATIDAAALAVANAVDNAVIHRAGTVADANGLSIYLPFGSDTVDSSYTAANHSYLANSSWDNFLALI